MNRVFGHTLPYVRFWDPNLNELKGGEGGAVSANARVIRAEEVAAALGLELQPGDEVWRVCEGAFVSEKDSQGRLVVILDALDEDGRRASGARLRLAALQEVFCHLLGAGRYWAGDKVIELREGLSPDGQFWARRSDDPMWGRIILRSAKAAGGLEAATAKAAWLDEVGQDDFTLESWEAVLRRLSLAEGRVLGTTTLLLERSTESTRPRRKLPCWKCPGSRSPTVTRGCSALAGWQIRRRGSPSGRAAFPSPPPFRCTARSRWK